jgi:hypothetical protein
MKFGLHTKYDHTKLSSYDSNRTIFNIMCESGPVSARLSNNNNSMLDSSYCINILHKSM